MSVPPEALAVNGACVFIPCVGQNWFSGEAHRDRVRSGVEVVGVGVLGGTIVCKLVELMIVIKCDRRTGLKTVKDGMVGDCVKFVNP